MFGFNFGEMLLILIVGIVVVGPRRLPTLMRTAGRWISKLRRMSTDLRSQSGIDDLIRQEGLEKELSELRALSRVNVIDTVLSAATAPPRPRPTPPAAPTPAPTPTSAPARPPARALPPPLVGAEPERGREYPIMGCDGYDVLPDDLSPYADPVATVAKTEADPPAPSAAKSEVVEAAASDPAPDPGDRDPVDEPSASDPDPEPVPPTKLEPETAAATAPTTGTGT